MKILFICTDGTDYLQSVLLHGLWKLGHEVIDIPYLSYMDKCNENKINRTTLYGNGFSYAFTIDEDRSIYNRTNIEEKISMHYFDIVIYAHKEPILKQKYLELVLQYYNLGEIFFIDGDDQAFLCDWYFWPDQTKNKILYFKRELLVNNYLFGTNFRLFPINYAIPKEKFQKRNYLKNTFYINDCSYGLVYNKKKESYIYESEQDYYNHYNSSFFALTCRKGGYDCMRHYEIIASHCLPVFADFDSLPRTVMTTWPTYLQYQANSLYLEHICNYASFDNDYQITKYYKLLDQFYDYAYKHLTTENLAKYLLSFC